MFLEKRSHYISSTESETSGVKLCVRTANTGFSDSIFDPAHRVAISCNRYGK